MKIERRRLSYPVPEKWSRFSFTVKSRNEVGLSKWGIMSTMIILLQYHRSYKLLFTNIPLSHTRTSNIKTTTLFCFIHFWIYHHILSYITQGLPSIILSTSTVSFPLVTPALSQPFLEDSNPLCLPFDTSSEEQETGRDWVGYNKPILSLIECQK